MAYNVDKSHELSDDGLYIENGFHLVGGSLSPLVSYPSPTTPSFYFQANGSLWKFPLGGPWKAIKNGSFSLHRISEEMTIENEQHLIVAGSLEILLTACLEIQLDSCLVIEE